MNVCCVPYSGINVMYTGMRIDELRRKKGIRTAEIADYLAINSERPIYAWYRGEYMPSLLHLCNLAKLFEVPLESILVFDS